MACNLTTGQPSTLGSYLDLCIMVYGPDSAATKFIEAKIKDSRLGRNEEVIADESQMVYLLTDLHVNGDRNV